MNYNEKLVNAGNKFNSIICMGLDPVIEDIPEDGAPGEVIKIFYERILNEIVKKQVYPGAVKPNYAFYAQYGFEGIESLIYVIELYRAEGIPVILDVKRGDIGKTAAAYARESFDFFKADAVTLSPYMGFDSILPFIELNPEGGFYVLTKTSNKSSGEIQDLCVGGRPIFIHVANKIVEWGRTGIGSVVGATYPEQLSEISNIFINSGIDVPLLIPGIGAQGGSLKDVLEILKGFKEIKIHRINSSSGINFAYKESDKSYPEAAVEALKKLNDEVNSLISI